MPRAKGRARGVADVFCGAGALSAGFEMAGFEAVAGVDCWGPAVRTFGRNHPRARVLRADITRVSDAQLAEWAGSADIVVGGPPCAPFSTAGRRSLDDPRSRLVREFLRVVEVVRPTAFLMENVSGFATFDRGNLVSELASGFERGGYLLACGVLDAVNYGVPQRRRRFFLAGSILRRPSLPRPTRGVPLAFWDAVSDLPPVEAGGSSAEYATPPQNAYQALMRSGNPPLTLHRAPRHQRRMVELIRRIPPGKSAFDVAGLIPPRLMPKSGYPNSYKRIRLDEPSPTITRNFTTPSSANCIHPLHHRALTLREGARLQSFQDRFAFEGSFTDNRLLIGNAVPPLLAKAVAEAVKDTLEKT